jgi:hypothetical protein
LDGCAKPYGILEEAPEIENFQTQTSQTHAGKSPQEAFALQGVTRRAPTEFLATAAFGPRQEDRNVRQASRNEATIMLDKCHKNYQPAFS